MIQCVHYLAKALLLTALAVLLCGAVRVARASGPYDGNTFKGRIAFSSDGNFNDEDDWGAFPVAAAILDAFGVTDKLVHVDYNNILPANDPRFYREMTDRSRIRFFINGKQQGSPWESPGRGGGWTTFTAPNVSVATGDLIAVEVQADSGAPAKLDYVELAYLKPT